MYFSFLTNWIFSILNSLGLYNKKARILFLGLNNAGKTTLLHMLKTGKMMTAEPTRYPQSEEIAIGNINFNTYDLGGHKSARRIWKDYFAAIQAIVYITDTTEDEEKFEEDRIEINNILADEVIKDIPILILGNKIDVISKAVNEATLKEKLGIDLICSGKTTTFDPQTRQVEVFMSSTVKKFGYIDGFKWLSARLNAIID